ncbi:hypothetical protein [Sphingomonas sp. NIBR02145]|uniref:hypothetical protein n=1 Tax=Sphingomonas sp. NIBR02145 TaxID=3014784 RepID=UPI0022B5CFAC|nr:hypothetical protein [Sphingomonas sp. NIBR02145]WHU03916.1 hypothetical protein O3305_04810 [Sphingomonas sp. NIBR02145]
MSRLPILIAALVLALLFDVALMREIAEAWQIPADVYRLLTMTAGVLISVYGMRAFTRAGAKPQRKVRS